MEEVATTVQGANQVVNIAHAALATLDRAAIPQVMKCATTAMQDNRYTGKPVQASWAGGPAGQTEEVE
jgi:hypothetical protein